MTTLLHDPAQSGTPSGDDPVALGWRILHRCIDDAPWPDRPHPIDHRFDVAWDPMSVGYGDLGVALVCSAADQRDPDGGWDTAAHRHVVEAVRRYSQTRDLTVGLFSGVAALAFTLRCLSRDGERYRGAIADVDAELVRRTRSLLAAVDPASGVGTADYDVISGLAGVMTYAMTTDAVSDPAVYRLTGDIRDRLTDLALATGDVGGFWTPGGRVSDIDAVDRDNLWAGYLNLGFAHGIAGVVSVLGQCVDRGLGGTRTRGAVDHLVDILERSARTVDTIDVPYHLSLAVHRRDGLTREARSNAELSRYAWCYGNPGVALALSNSDHCRSTRRGLVDDLDNADDRTAAQRVVDNPSLCHGSAGLLLMDRWVHGRSGSPWLAETIGHHDEGARLLLRNRQLGVDHLDSPGFLDGAGGAAVALVAQDGNPEPHCLRALSGRWSA
ncbi:lanthionine synthetase C family protein [uncultured Williamsia sp.]|uniref:lanthionine synthetase C family protein n=1 Tax=uncultured Williamsia sp. TaxID=259311 RepID=UPI00261A7DF4|nr:lanthionine synthetase C family protein [uncultured Williamsia sp.]